MSTRKLMAPQPCCHAVGYTITLCVRHDQQHVPGARGGWAAGSRPRLLPAERRGHHRHMVELVPMKGRARRDLPMRLWACTTVTPQQAARTPHLPAAVWMTAHVAWKLRPVPAIRASGLCENPHHICRRSSPATATPASRSAMSSICTRSTWLRSSRSSLSSPHVFTTALSACAGCRQLSSPKDASRLEMAEVNQVCAHPNKEQGCTLSGGCEHIETSARQGKVCVSSSDVTPVKGIQRAVTRTGSPLHCWQAC